MNRRSPAPARLMYSEAESSATSNSFPPTMRSKTSRPDLSVMQLRSTPSMRISPSRMASIRSYRQQPKLSERRDTGGDHHAAPHPPNRGGREGPSALGELEGASCLGLAVLLALDHARIARQEAAALERAAQVGLVSH